MQLDIDGQHLLAIGEDRQGHEPAVHFGRLIELVPRHVRDAEVAAEYDAALASQHLRNTAFRLRCQHLQRRAGLRDPHGVRADEHGSARAGAG